MTLSVACRAALQQLAKLEHRDASAAAIAPHLDAAARTALRDMLIREALQRFYGDLPKTQRARTLAADLVRGEPGGSPRADFCVAILAANGGRPMAWRHLVNIADGLTRSSATVPLQPRPRSVQFC